jgi:hypothetical protein
VLEEDTMTTNEMYYLIMVCAAFAALGLILGGETAIYRRSLSRSAKRNSRDVGGVGKC